MYDHHTFKLITFYSDIMDNGAPLGTRIDNDSNPEIVGNKPQLRAQHKRTTNH